jgi:hypothetical protein
VATVLRKDLRTPDYLPQKVLVKNLIDALNEFDPETEVVVLAREYAGQSYPPTALEIRSFCDYRSCAELSCEGCRKAGTIDVLAILS